MCGVIGAVIQPSLIPELKRIFLETRVRGKHATGLSYLKGGIIHTIIKKSSADILLQDLDFNGLINEDGYLYVIGHIRYSTSDLRYNQPISNGEISIAHNGVISQEPKDQWKYKTVGGNDSELVLQSFLSGNHPLLDFPESSQAVTSLWAVEKEVRAFRNGKRPLWITELSAGTFFTSTRDISLRAIGKGAHPIKCKPYTEMIIDKTGLKNKAVTPLVDWEELQV